MAVHAHPLPPNALLQRYAADLENYTDCFVKDVQGTVSLADFMTAFYTTPLFKAERVVLKLALRKPSPDANARAVATGETDTFAAWTVEDRTDNEALMRDLSGGTRSWFKVAPIADGTRLYFGSAVTPGTGVLIRALIPLHRVYARSLLGLTKPQGTTA